MPICTVALIQLARQEGTSDSLRQNRDMFPTDAVCHSINVFIGVAKTIGVGMTSKDPNQRTNIRKEREIS